MAVPELLGSLPSVVYLVKLMPEPLPSLAVSVTLTLALFQPAPFAAGAAVAVTVGGVVSITIPAIAVRPDVAPVTTTVLAPSADDGIVRDVIVALPPAPTTPGELATA